MTQNTIKKENECDPSRHRAPSGSRRVLSLRLDLRLTSKDLTQSEAKYLSSLQINKQVSKRFM